MKCNRLFYKWIWFRFSRLCFFCFSTELRAFRYLWLPIICRINFSIFLPFLHNSSRDDSIHFPCSSRESSVSVSAIINCTTISIPVIFNWILFSSYFIRRKSVEKSPTKFHRSLRRRLVIHSNMCCGDEGSPTPKRRNINIKSNEF